MFFKSYEKQIMERYHMPPEDVIAWQNLLTGCITNEIHLSRESLMETSLRTLEQHNRIIDDCVRLVNTTTSPYVFFKRWDMLLYHCQIVNKYERFIPFKHPLPSEQYAMILHNRYDTEKLFIKRAFDSASESAEKLKTPAGRKRKIDNFFIDIESYSDEFLPESLEYIEVLKSEKNIF
uniref:Uncharacterized protein n=1 Tax=Siphoviridae sp. ctPsO101 TaxID=2825487 RepID=A0A8S5PWZ9_9CAUD|nr:MAG TPA: hypothetical protein [Siphoviridae sp. ctPsO101]